MDRLPDGRCLIDGKRGLHICVDEERADWSRSPGREVVMRFGPFVLYVNTADSGRVHFSVQIGKGYIGWGIVANED